MDYRIFDPEGDGKSKLDHVHEMLIAAIASKAGGVVPQINDEFARADFSTTDVKVEIQVTSTKPVVAIIRGSSLSSVGRTYEMNDGIGETTKKIVAEMKGFVVTNESRE